MHGLAPSRRKSSHLPAISADNSSSPFPNGHNITLLNLPVDREDDHSVDPHSPMHNVDFEISESSGPHSPSGISGYQNRSSDQGIAAGATSMLGLVICSHAHLHTLVACRVFLISH